MSIRLLYVRRCKWEQALVGFEISRVEDSIRHLYILGGTLSNCSVKNYTKIFFWFSWAYCAGVCL
jgi:hypothetical protein